MDHMISSFSYKRKVSEHMIFVGLTESNADGVIPRLTVTVVSKMTSLQLHPQHQVFQQEKCLRRNTQNASRIWGVRIGKNCVTF